VNGQEEELGLLITGKAEAALVVDG
jgi:hypothetical protein